MPWDDEAAIAPRDAEDAAPPPDDTGDQASTAPSETSRQSEVMASHSTDAAEREVDFEERAALIEHDAGAPRAWAEALSRLDPDHPPGDVPLRRWVQFINDCGHFLDHGWAAKAERLGWTQLDLFGCDRIRPFARVDCGGLLPLLAGNELVNLTSDRAVIEMRVTGSLQSFYRKPAEPDCIPAWELLGVPEPPGF
jgi:hypothetical protein